MNQTATTQTQSLPSAPELELAVLGAVLIDTGAADVVVPILKTPRVFADKKNQLIYHAVQTLYTESQPIDILTVSQKLKEMKRHQEAGGDSYIISCTQGVASSAHVEYHSRILMQQYLRRMVITFNSRINSLALDDSVDVFDLLSRWQKEFDKVSELISTGRGSQTVDLALQELLKDVEYLSTRDKDQTLMGVDTGFKTINRITGGYRNQDLAIIAARPGMGKTAYVLKVARENIRKGIPVGFISLEMSVKQLTARLVAIDTNFHLKQLLKTGFEKKKYFDRYREHQQRIQTYPFFMDDSAASDITDILMQAKTWKRLHGIQILIIDYLQLIGDRSIKGNREQEISSISRRLKMLAKELDIPVIVLSQLSRAVETRGGDKRPRLSDLRESGAIEQDADIVQFIYRPEYYDINVQDIQYDDPEIEQQRSRGGDSEIHWAKYRGGSPFFCLLKWLGDKTKFVDPQDETEPQGPDESDVPF